MESMITDNYRPAGFWVRFAASIIDFVIVGIVIKFIALVLYYFNIYVPAELTFLIVLMFYSSVLIGWKGKTIGKTLCGLVVMTSKGKTPGYVRAFGREIIGKLVSTVFLFIGFIWIGFTRRKRGFHDYIAATLVRQDVGSIKQARWLVAMIFAVVAVLIAPKLITGIMRYKDITRLTVTWNKPAAYSNRDPSTLVDVNSIKQKDHEIFAKWLNENGKDPVDYVVEAVSKHQITIFGEVHHIRDNLQFLSQIVPDLYHHAGVTCIAMEVLTMEDNAKLAKLVTDERFDNDLAMQIARDEGWKAWGDKEYWDVLETVWQLNKSLPAGAKKLRLVGLDFQWDGPSFSMIKGQSEETSGGPIWEKLRLIRILHDFVFLMKRDEVMARNVEKEIIEKGERGIVWVGLNHDYINYRQAWVQKGQVINEWGRMGFMLHYKYGEKVFHIRLHNSYGSPQVAGLIEKAAAERGNLSVGFDVIGSPFGCLREKDAEYYRFQPNVCFADVASGYIYLGPQNKLKRCRWQDGYVTNEMFVKNKPYYEYECGHKLKNVDEANKSLANKYRMELAK